MSETTKPRPTPFGILARAERERLGLSREQTAALADVSEARLRHIENGWQQVGDQYKATHPSRNTVRRIAVALDIPMGKALHAAGFQPDESDTEPIPDVEQNKRVFRLWNKLDATDQNLAYGFMARMAKVASNQGDTELLAS